MKKYIPLFALVALFGGALSTHAATITAVSSKAAPEGTIYSGEQATITGTNLSGVLTIKLGVQEPKTIQATGLGNSVSFTVPQYQQTSYVSMIVTDSSGEASNSLSVKIEVPGKPSVAAVVTNIQSVTNPAWTVDSGKKASIYGSGLSGPLTIKLGNIEPRYVQTTGTSDTYAEFIVPSYAQSVVVSAAATNASGLKSNVHSLNIQAPSSVVTPSPTTGCATGALSEASCPGIIQKRGCENGAVFNVNTGVRCATVPADIDPEPATTSCLDLMQDLRYRSTGTAVSGLQDYLQASGHLNSEPTGYFGLLTLQAVKNFQSSQSISPTGFVGPLTRAKIKTLTCN